MEEMFELGEKLEITLDLESLMVGERGSDGGNSEENVEEEIGCTGLDILESSAFIASVSACKKPISSTRVIHLATNSHSCSRTAAVVRKKLLTKQEP